MLDQDDRNESVHDGPYGHLHLRDLFAAHAMTGICANGHGVKDAGFAAAIAYEIADAMLAHRAKNVVKERSGMDKDV